MSQKRKRIKVLLVILFLVACSPPNNLKSTVISSVTEINLIGSTATGLIPTKTKTLSTATAEETTSITSQPTFSAEDARLILQTNLKNNGNCRLPCFWGFTPGDTRYEESVAFMERLGDIAVPNSIEVSNSSFEDANFTSISLWETDSRIYMGIEINNLEGILGHTKFYTGASREEGTPPEVQAHASYGNPFFQQSLEYYFLPSILTTYGKPSVVLIAPFPDDLPYIGDFGMVLYYPDQWFFIQYIFPKDERDGKFIGCPSKSAYIDVITWPPQEEFKISEIVKDMSGSGINELNYNYFKPISDVTTMSLDDFYQTFRNRGDDNH
jgi:hypothetical protein